jgi:MYXO-CTERM domain-containing protein
VQKCFGMLMVMVVWSGTGQAQDLQADLSPAFERIGPGAPALQRAWIQNGMLQVDLGADVHALAGRDQLREDLIRDLLWAARRTQPDLRGIRVWVNALDGSRQSLASALGDRRTEATLQARHSTVDRKPRGLPPAELPYGGSLSGRRVALSPGHGLTWYDNLNDWSYQRGLINMPGCESCLGIIEDLSNNQIAVRYLIPHLLRAGAQVWSVRERDFSSFEALVDDGDPGVEEQGAWTAGNSDGGFGDDYRVLLAGDGGSVSYALEPEAEGEAWVSIWFVEGPNRVADALYRIHHLGGVAEHHLDQTAKGSRWIHLGQYRFAPGAGGRLEIMPGPAAEVDRYLIADAVRLGGGVDTTEVSGKPADAARWRMSARFYLPYFGLPDAVHTGSDVTVRPAWAEWQGADIYLSLHSNASGGGTNAASGTSTYRFNCYAYPDHSSAPDPALCDDPPGSDRLQRTLHESMIEFLRAEWDPAWRDRGRLVANFGEMRVLDQIPGALVESAFHDGTEKNTAEMRMPDNQALQDPRFRAWLGYAMYAGIVRYFDEQAPLLPARPVAGLRLTHAVGGGMRVAWSADPSAQGYRVRFGLDGLGLGEGLVTEDTQVVLEDPIPGQLVAVRVSALNAGGEGPPSELAVARYRGNGTFADLLLVSGFDRQDAYVGDGHNRRDQAAAHAEALRALADRKIYFDFASNESLIDGALELSDYPATIWILGEESTEHDSFDTTEQEAVLDYINGGGALMASGSEIGWDLVDRGEPADELFFSDAFDSIYLADDADSHQVSGSGLFDGLGSLAFDDGSAGIYPVEWPDVFEAFSASAEVVLAYDSGEGAAVASVREPGRSLLIGFPFETLVDAEARWTLMGAVVDFLLPGHTPDDFDGDGLPDAWEYENDTDPQRPSADEDPDQDGKSNAEEFAAGTDPQAPEGGDGGSELDEPTGGCGCAATGTRNDALGALMILLTLLLRRRHRC